KDGLDEISLGGATLVGELRDGKLREYEIEPEQFGLPMASSRNLRVANAGESKAMLLQVLDGTDGVARNIVLLNAGAALYAAGVALSIADGIARAGNSIDDGSARAKLDKFVQATRELADAESRAPGPGSRSS
ncbi:MAG: anthranilate phosphoribosyltransferase, partial [Rhodanobacteraceae bacterium]